MNYRTAVRILISAAARKLCGSAEYTRANVGLRVHLANIAPTVLYRLAAGEYTAEQEAEILATAKVERVDIARADGICEELWPEEPEASNPRMTSTGNPYTRRHA